MSLTRKNRILIVHILVVFGNGKLKNLLRELRELQVEFAWGIVKFYGSCPLRILVQEFCCCMWRVEHPNVKLEKTGEG